MLLVKRQIGQRFLILMCQKQGDAMTALYLDSKRNSLNYSNKCAGYSKSVRFPPDTTTPWRQEKMDATPDHLLGRCSSLGRKSANEAPNWSSGGQFSEVGNRHGSACGHSGTDQGLSEEGRK